ncbi:hypothetical protein [Carboxylicivirga marina]|uniref:hypothetical protein n=1 Tax=Carboxylicivirga marina TaxID=2800988 RepID=UPI00259A31F7|nr:hypothetical protein [uncultured Carboxylicivirga sp.]
MAESKANIIQTQKPAFTVSKWFFDSVTKEGFCIIAYAAILKWRGICVPYSSLLFSKPGKDNNVNSSFKKVEWPICNEGKIKWHSKAVGANGEWTQQGSMFKKQLFNSEEGGLDWCCYQSFSDVKVELHNGKKYSGKGYVEHLKLTVEPWKINLSQLRWGHFFSGSVNMVWVDFRGVEPKRWLWYNGEQVEVSVLNDKVIVIPDLQLTLHLVPDRVLEQGHKIAYVVKKLLRLLPGFNKIVPEVFLMAKETKWLSKGQLYRNGLMHDKGWSIHELVDFKGS